MTDLNVYRLTSGGGTVSGNGSVSKAGGESGVNFTDFLEMVNPLQHLPVVSQIYRSETGSDIPAIAKIIGGGVFGGAVGVASSALVSLVEAFTDKPLIESAAQIVGLSDQNITSNNINLVPDSGEASYNLVGDVNILQKVVDNNKPNEQLVEDVNLIGLRKSAVGLPEFGIEQQLNNQLHDKTVDLI